MSNPRLPYLEQQIIEHTAGSTRVDVGVLGMAAEPDTLSIGQTGGTVQAEGKKDRYTQTDEVWIGWIKGSQ